MLHGCRFPAGAAGRRVSIGGVPVRRHGDSRASENEDVTTMMLYDVSRVYHAERIMTVAEQRRADDQLGMMAAAVSRRWRRLTRPVRARRARSSRTAAYAR
jgi:hypothetical protein